MRKLINKNNNLHLILGGKIRDYLGKVPGIYEEAYYSFVSKKPIFLLGGFEGATLKLIDLIINKKSEDFLIISDEFLEFYNNKSEKDKLNKDEFIQFFKDLTINDLNNGLSEEENKILFYSVSVFEIIYLILKGIKNVYSM